MKRQLDINRCPLMNEKFKSKIKSRILLALIGLVMISIGVIVIAKYDTYILELVNLLRNMQKQ